MRKNEKITALYERLSRDDFGKDDDQQRESNSISNQKAMLEEFAARQGFTNIVHFTDDGISGTCFDRPGFLAMMKEVEAGNVEYLCIKDMSRMGRDYLKVGQIMEILRQRGVRLIAINDGVDSARGDDDFKDLFKKKTSELELTMQKLDSEIKELESKQEPEIQIEDYAEKLTVLQYALEQYTNWDDKDIPESVIEAFVVKIVASKDGFDWYLRFNGNPDDPLHCTVGGKRKSTATISVAGECSPAVHKGNTGRN